MNEPSSDLSARTLPPWLTEAADVLWERRRLVVAAALVTVVIGIVGAMMAPSLLPPRAIVGAAVGLAAVLLAAAIGLAVDAADLIVRGARHVRAAGADVAASIGPDVRDIGPLLARVGAHAENGRIRVALVPASRDAGAPGARASALAEALARTGRRVLVTDLTRPATPTPGLSEVVTGERRLAEVAHLEDDLYLARVPVGTNPVGALQGLVDWVGNLPSDLDVLVVALPPLAEPAVMPAATFADLLLIQVEANRTERVDLIAALDAVDAANLTAEVVLVDPARSWTERQDTAATAPAPHDPTAEATAPDTPAPEAAAPDAVEPTDDDDGRDVDADAVDEEGPDVVVAAPVNDGSDDHDLPDAVDERMADDASESDATDTSEMALGVLPPAVVAAPLPGRGHPRDLAHVWDDSPAAEGEVAFSEPEPEPEPAPEPEPEPEPEPAPDLGADPVPEPDRAPVAEAVPAGRTSSPPTSSGNIDDLARESVRTAAALYALAEEVWRREDGA